MTQPFQDPQPQSLLSIDRNGFIPALGVSATLVAQELSGMFNVTVVKPDLRDNPFFRIPGTDLASATRTARLLQTIFRDNTLDIAVRACDTGGGQPCVTIDFTAAELNRLRQAPLDIPRNLFLK